MTQNLVIEIPAELFAPAESSSYMGEYEVDSFEFGADTYVPERPFSWNVVISNVGGAFLVTGSVSGRVITTCARCLEEASFDIQGDVEGYFIVEGEGEVPDDMEEDEFEFLPNNNQIDLQPLLMAAIYVELPLIPLCKEDCAGICPQCGANLNEGSCDCAATEPQKQDGINPDNPFAALQNFKFDEQ